MKKKSIRAEEFDREAHRLGITRQSVIKYWISEKLHPSAE